MKEMIQKHPLLKRFLMTLAATTISIVLTFGTTAIIDWTKQKAEKREMAMMILYNLHETLTEAERCDENLRTYFDIQLDVVAHPQKMDGNFANLAAAIPQFDYTTTTENIFNSTIETLQTIGNITKATWWTVSRPLPMPPLRTTTACSDSIHPLTYS